MCSKSPKFYKVVAALILVITIFFPSHVILLPGICVFVLGFVVTRPQLMYTDPRLGAAIFWQESHHVAPVPHQAFHHTSSENSVSYHLTLYVLAWVPAPGRYCFEGS